MDSKRPDDPCPKCGRPLVRRPHCFCWRGVYYDGAVCDPCSALWAISGEEMPPLRPTSVVAKLSCDVCRGKSGFHKMDCPNR